MAQAPAQRDPRYQQYAAQQKQQAQVQTRSPVPMEQRLQQEQQQFRQDVNTAQTQAGRPALFQQQQPAAPAPQQPVQQPAPPQQPAAPQNLIEAKKQEYIRRMEEQKAAKAQQEKPNMQQAQQQKLSPQQAQQQKQQPQQPKREIIKAPEALSKEQIRQQQIQDAQNKMRENPQTMQTISNNAGVKPVTGGLGGTVSQAPQRPQQAVTNTPQMSPVGAAQQIQTTTGTVNAQGNNRQGFGTTGGLNSQPQQQFYNLRNNTLKR